MDYRNASLSVEQRVDDLLARLTLGEKIGQLLQFHPAEYATQQQTYLAGVRAGRWGSVIVANSAWAGNENGPSVDVAMLEALQRAAVEGSRWGIPLLIGRDVIYGHRTVFPIPLAQAASFDPAGTEAALHCAAREARAEGVNWTFSPGIDVTREPRWGRIIESYGEDPFLGSCMAAAAVRGFQGQDPSQPDRLLACAKVFCGYGFVQGGRDYDAADISNDTLYNVVLPPFRAAVAAGVASVMTSFSELGGYPPSAHAPLLRGWLKDGLNWPGFVVSDWGAIGNIEYFRVAADQKEAALLALRAGVDLEMTAGAYEAHLEALVTEGTLDPALVDDAVRRILRAKFKAGLFERPYPAFDGKTVAGWAAEHRCRAAEVAARCVVLLRNQDDVLPLPAKGLRLALAGPYTEARREHLGSWCLDGRPSEVVTILQGLRKAAPGLTIETGEAAFAGADLIVLCMGESHERNGENRSTVNIQLPPDQEEFIRAAARTGKPLVVVNCSGRPLSSPAAESHAKAILQAWNLGTEAGTAIANILMGAREPSGRLPFSIPRHVGQLPIHYNRKTPGRVRVDPSWYTGYLDEQLTPLYPFGFGLGYTTFDYGPVQLGAGTMKAGGVLEARVTVTNRGVRGGTAVVQLYLGDRLSAVSRPDRELKGFQRIDLGPGESRTAVFRITEDLLRYYLPDGSPRVDPGEFDVWIGADCRTTNHALFRLEASGRPA